MGNFEGCENREDYEATVRLSRARTRKNGSSHIQGPSVPGEGAARRELSTDRPEVGMEPEATAMGAAMTHSG